VWPWHASSRCALAAPCCRCCAVSRCHALGEAALIAVGQLAGSPRGQQQLLEAGALAFIVPLLFRWVGGALLGWQSGQAQ
jgi:hypothetical protein